MTGSRGGRITTSVSDYSKPRLGHLLSWIYSSLPTYTPLPLLDPPPRGRVHLLPCPPTSPVTPPHRIIRPPVLPLYPSQHTNPTLFLHRVLRSFSYIIVVYMYPLQSVAIIFNLTVYQKKIYISTRLDKKTWLLNLKKRKKIQTNQEQQHIYANILFLRSLYLLQEIHVIS